MKIKIYRFFVFCFSIILFFISISTTILCAEETTGTDVFGIIDTDVYWLKSNGPYYVVGSVDVDTDATLTIEPGTTIFFKGNYSLSLSGTMIAVGTENEPINFTSNENWGSIIIDDDNKGLSKIKYCNFEKIYRAISSKSRDLTVISNQKVTVENCNISNCETGFLDCNLVLKNSTLSNCHTGIVGFYTKIYDSNITNCLYSGCEDLSTHAGLRLICERSNFTNCGTGISASGYLEVSISETNFNNKVGIEINQLKTDSSYISIEKCNFYDSDYYIELGGTSINIPNNYFNSENPSDKIYDYYDNTNLKKVIYEPKLSVPYGSGLVSSNHNSGQYENDIAIALSTTEGYEIYYTCDGTEPKEYGVYYSEPFILSKSTKLRCVAYKDGAYGEETIYEYVITHPSNYKIKSISFTDLNGNSISDINDYSDFLINLNIDRIISYDKSYYIVCTSYDTDNRFSGFDLFYCNLNILQSNAIKFKIDNMDRKVKYIKCFIWDNFNNIKPLSNAILK